MPVVGTTIRIMDACRYPGVRSRSVRMRHTQEDSKMIRHLADDGQIRRLLGKRGLTWQALALSKLMVVMNGQTSFTSYVGNIDLTHH